MVDYVGQVEKLRTQSARLLRSFKNQSIAIKSLKFSVDRKRSVNVFSKRVTSYADC